MSVQNYLAFKGEITLGDKTVDLGLKNGTRMNN